MRILKPNTYDSIAYANIFYLILHDCPIAITITRQKVHRQCCKKSNLFTSLALLPPAGHSHLTTRRHLTTRWIRCNNQLSSYVMGAWLSKLKTYLYGTEMKCTHVKCRNPNYPCTDVKRFPVSDEFVSWNVEYTDYKPVDYTDQKVINKPVWADVDIRNEEPIYPAKFNELDMEHNIDRRSHDGKYSINIVPRNPVGRTGMTGRGLLGRWGPNHAADPIVTRWKLDEKCNKVRKNGHPILEFVSIQRRDTGEWAVPGGMVEPGDNVPNTLKKEFGEEALNSIEASDEEKKKISDYIDQLFESGGQEIFKGYVDDPRNTDNAWMETVAVNFHDDTGSAFNKIQLKAGDDAKAVTWLEADSGVNLYASHSNFIEKTCKLHGAFF